MSGLHSRQSRLILQRAGFQQQKLFWTLSIVDNMEDEVNKFNIMHTSVIL